MTDPFEELERRLEQTRQPGERQGARDEEVTALRDQWRKVFTALGQQVRDLMARLREREGMAGDVRPTDYGFRLMLVANIGKTRRECSFGIPREIRVSCIFVDEDGAWGSKGETVARVILPLSDHVITFTRSGRLGWRAEDGSQQTADAMDPGVLRRFLTDLVAQDLLA
ncbi:MAG: hypothetical protein HY704_02785 [Gemmatimonadetes bacterium]|nr:hypothetical protein [Gemmatimonadota bacterium]